jgi:D-alanyl-D-alanine carboxypeptidase/D-alanyl-D-alanine-endopeptidase (penicillin-binding protein 4)
VVVRVNKIHCCLLLSVFCLSAAAQTPRETIDALTATPPFQRAVWGIDIEEQDGTVVYQRNADVLMIPASNRKLFAMATAASCLGFDARFTTELWLDGGDVVIRGDGDPSFGSWRHESPGFAPFVDALKKRGIASVRDVIADVSRFDRVTIPYNWKMGNLPYDYAAPVDAIAYDENAIGDQSVPDAGDNAALRFRDALRDAGIAVTGDVRTAAEPHAWGERIAAVQSPFVFQLLATALKNSHNLYAEMLYKRATPDGKYDEAFAMETDLLKNEAFLADGEFRFVDGSGLAPDDLVTPAATVKILRWMNAPARRPMWWALLAVPGEEGTLHYRLTEFADRLRGKTGTVNGVNSLSGILRGRNGRFRYFSIVINHHLASSGQATALIDAVVRAVDF